jgi:hypothetical protein
MQTALEGLLTAHELAERLQVGTRSLEEWRRRGKGPRYVRLSGHKGVRYTAAPLRHGFVSFSGCLAAGGG